MLLSLLAGAPVPQALHTTVRLAPADHAFAVEGTWTFDGPGRAALRLAPDVAPTFDAPSGPGWVDVPASGRVAFTAAGQVHRVGADFVGVDSAVLNGVTYRFYPDFAGDVPTVTCVSAPEGWVVRATGDAEGECFRADRTRWFLVAGRRDGFELRRGDFGVVVASESTAGPLLDAVERITEEEQRWYGARPSRTLTVVEVPFDGGFSGIGLIVIHPGAVRAFVDGDAEGAFLAHEVAHQWFGGVLNSSDAIREGLATYTALRYERARSEARGRAYREKLLANAARARPGRTIREIRREYGWREYEAVAYARSALVFDALEREIGEDAMDAWLRSWVRTSSEAMSFEALLGPLAGIAPDFDRDEFVRVAVNSDWDPATGLVRPFVWTLDGWVAALMVLAAFAAARRYRSVVDGLLAVGAIVLFMRTPWLIAWPALLGAAVVVLASQLPKRWRWVSAVGYGIAGLAVLVS